MNPISHDSGSQNAFVRVFFCRKRSCLLGKPPKACARQRGRLTVLQGTPALPCLSAAPSEKAGKLISLPVS
jgi:hypothetical protein